MPDLGPQKLDFIIKSKKKAIKPPAYEWQDFALRIINELHIPNFKRNSVFKICKDNSTELVQRAVNETKELCKSGQQWQYFFKVIDSLTKKE